MPAWTIVVAAGSGTRFGALKQYEPLGGRRVLDWSLETARAVSDGVVLVVPVDQIARAEPGVDVVVAGGATRSQSVRAGLAAVPPEADVVVVHDGARPMAGVALFERVIAAIGGETDAAVPGLAPSSTIKRVDRTGPQTIVTETFDRRSLVEIQTPQAFSAKALRRAHASEPEATDDAALVEAAGGRVVVVDGKADNIKITDPHDLDVARALLDRVAARNAGPETRT